MAKVDYGTCPDCGRKAVYECECPADAGETKRIQFMFYRPFVDIHTTGDPMPLMTRKERDEFHEANGVTMDSNRYGRRAKPRSAVDDVPTEQILHDLKHGNFPKLPDHLDPVEKEPLRSEAVKSRK